MRIKLIINPVSGDGSGRRSLYKIVKIFEKAKVDFSVDVTRGRAPDEIGSGKDLATKAINDGYDTIIAAGGDGTINEVVNGIVNSDITFGVIPVGFGNDFVKALKIPYKIDKACEIILAGRTKLIDVGIINNKYFANSVGFGFDGEVLHEAIKTRGKLHSIVRYVIGVVKVFFTFTGIKFSMILDDTREINVDALMVVISNGSYEASGFPFNPDAELDDGFLNICLVEKMRKVSTLYHLFLAMYGKHTSSKYIKFFKAKSIFIKAENILFGHMDGEPVTDYSFDIKVLPQKLKILVP